MKKEFFENANIKFARDEKHEIYSMIVWLNKVPRILTFRIGKDIVEASLSDMKGNVLETLSHEGGELKYAKKK